MRGSDRKLCLSEKAKGKVWKDYMERIMNEENDWNHNVEGYAVEGPVVCISREEVLQTLNENRKSPLSLTLPEGVLSELLYADDFVLMSEAIKELRDKCLKWKEAVESKGLKVNLG